MLFYSQKVIFAFPVVTSKNFDNENNDRPPALKLRKWLMRNKESTLPGLTDNILFPKGGRYRGVLPLYMIILPLSG